jgi:glycosyltransferase involved in cell wall biosynthesis
VTWPRAPLVMVSSSSRTGPAEGLISLARELRSLGLDARFGGDTVRPGENLGEHLAHAGVPWEQELRLSRKVRLGDVWHDVRLLAEWARSGRFDVFHAAFAHDHLVSLLAARRARNPDLRVVRAAQRRADVEPGFLSRRLWALRRSDGVVVHCEAYRKLLLEHLQPERIAVVPAGVDAHWFSPGRAPDLRARWGIPADAPLAGIVARMKPERGHRTLLQAFPKVLRDVPEAFLVLVGRGEDEEPLRAYAREMAISDRVVFGGYLRGPGLVEAYRALDVAVWLREGNDGACRGVLEAMACGVPVVAGSEGAPGELAGDTGRIVDPADPDAVARALSELLLSKSRELGLAARERALQFTPRRAAEATLAFWRKLRDLSPA